MLRSSQDQEHYLAGIGAWADEAASTPTTGSMEDDLLLIENDMKKKDKKKNKAKKDGREKGHKTKKQGPNK